MRDTIETIADVHACAEQAIGGVLLGLDETGTAAAALPPPLDDPRHALVGSEYWDPERMDTPLDAMFAGDLEVVVATFLAAVETGYATCSARVADGRPVLLRVWNFLTSHGVVVVLGEPTDQRASPSIHGSRHTPQPLVLVHTVTVHGLISSIDDATRTVLGWGDEVLGQSRLHFQDAETNADAPSVWTDVLAFPNRSFRRRIQLRTASGEWRWFDTTTHNRLATQGDIVIEHVDITEHVADRPQTSPMIALADALADRMEAGVLCLDERGHVLAVNERFTALTQVVVDRERRRLQPAPRVVAEPLRRVVRTALGDREARPHHAFVAHAQHRLRITATKLRMSPTHECCVVTVDERLRGPGAEAALPKGLSGATLERVVAAISGEGSPVSVPQLAESTGLSPVSIRRYLSYLVRSGEVAVHRNYGQRGRPGQTYSLAVGGGSS